MADDDFKALRLVELRALRQRLDAAIRERTIADKAEVRRQMEKLAVDAGFEFDDVVGAAKRGRPPVVRYRDEDDEQAVWNGRGAMPDWLRAHVEAGRSKDEFAVEPEVAHVNGAA